MTGWLNPTSERMNDLLTFLLLATAMGLSIFLSLPIILAKGMRSRTIVFLNASAIGILVFLLADIFGDVAPIIAATQAFLTLPGRDVLFVVAVVGVYTLLYLIDQRRPLPAGGASTPAGPAPPIAARTAWP